VHYLLVVENVDLEGEDLNVTQPVGGGTDLRDRLALHFQSFLGLF
jgi:hypothetical protein